LEVGNGSDGGMTPVDRSSPYLSGTTVPISAFVWPGPFEGPDLGSFLEHSGEEGRKLADGLFDPVAL